MAASPKPRNEFSTAEAILSAATEVFANKGYDGARVDEIACAAKVNKATLYYQIGDKQALYEAVIVQVMSRMADELEGRMPALSSASEQLRGFIETLADHADIAKQFSPIMMREVAGGGQHLPDTALGQMGRILGLLNSILERGVENGEFRPANTLVTHMLIVGSLMVYNTSGPIRTRIAALDGNPLDEEHFMIDEEVAGYVTDQVLASVRKGAEK